jgi:hypothetical protein
MARPLVVLLGIAMLGSTGCRTVWVHADADPERYAADQRVCRAQAAQPAQGRWRDCMVAHGWSPTLGFRWQEPFATR